MGFYDYFSNFYDASLEKVYADARALAAEALDLRSDSVVLDVPCGTGQSFGPIASRLGPTGRLFAVDASPGMLARARSRASRTSGSAAIVCALGDAAQLTASQLQAAAGSQPGAADRALAITHLHVFLGMSVFSDMQATFAALWGLLAPSGVCVLVDVHAERLGLQGRLVNLIARADIRRRFWEPLERASTGFERRDLPYDSRHGGQIMLARGVKA
jgi:SAM-dependent methyltransferase